jgi:hypothetical protein
MYLKKREDKEMHINHYHAIDQADHMIKNTANRYITWKYWHAPYLHAVSMGIVAAYDMYLDCAEGFLDEAWVVPKKKRMNFAEFRSRLSEQMLTYNPRLKCYPGDEKFRDSTQLNRSRRSFDAGTAEAEATSTTPANTDSSKKMSFLDWYTASSTGDLPQCCNTADDLKAHSKSVQKTTNARPCEVCGKLSIWKCTQCGKHMCTKNDRKWDGMKCLMIYHSHEFFGLSRSDHKKVHKQTLHSWRAPTDDAMEKNARVIRRMIANEAARREVAAEN